MKAGEKNNRLTAVEKGPKFSGKWVFVCDCGTKKLIRTSHVGSGITKSCGCLRREYALSGKSNLKHGFARNSKVHSLHGRWRGIKKRCYAKNTPGFKYYGGRGIKVCEEWKDNFKAFYDWCLSSGYKKNLSIDRIDNNGDYSPGNCTWSTKKEQARNRRTSRIVTIEGISRTIAEWAEVLGKDYGYVYNKFIKNKDIRLDI